MKRRPPAPRVPPARPPVPPVSPESPPPASATPPAVPDHPIFQTRTGPARSDAAKPFYQDPADASAEGIDAEPVIDLDADADFPDDPGEQDGPLRCQFTVKSTASRRLDVYLQNRLKGVSRSRVQKLIDLAAVTLNGHVAKSSSGLRVGDVIDVILPPRAARTIQPEPIPIAVLYEDDHFIILNKQAGVLVHPARNHLSGTLLNGLAWRFKQQQEAAGLTWQARSTSGFRRIDRDKGIVEGLSKVGAAEFRPGIIHRLDKNTTGVLVVGKSDEAHWQIARQFEFRTTLKAYLAVVHGNFDEVGGVVDQAIGKHPTIHEAFAVRNDHQSKHAVSIYRVREQYKGYSLVEVELKTGRTHQIRVHMTWLGHPIVGDILYGGEPVGEAELDTPSIVAGSRRMLTYAREKSEGQRLEREAAERSDLIIAHPALHATLLRFTHPIEGKEMTFTAPLHEPVGTLVRSLRSRRIEAPVARDGYWVDLDKAVPEV